MSLSFIRDRSVGAKLGIGFGLVLVLLCAAVALGVQSTKQISNSAIDKFSGDAIPLREATQDLVTQMVNQETGVRGFLVTADDTSLDPYNAGRRQVAADLQTIEPYLAEHPIMGKLIGEAKPQIAELQRYFAS